MGANLEVMAAIPGLKSHVERLQHIVGPLAFPHHPVVKEENSMPVLRPANVAHHLASCCMHRVSILWAAGANAAREAVGRVRDLPNQAHLSAMPNEHGKCCLHPDPRDAGEGAVLLGRKDAIAAGVRVVMGGEEGPLLQLVHVFSWGCLEFEALSAVGLTEGGISLTLLAPAVQMGEGVRCVCYALDFSKEWHGNPSGEGGRALPPDAWALRCTAYATAHGATWAERIRSMRPSEARHFLRSCMGMPGSLVLGRDARGTMVHERLQGMMDGKGEEGDSEWVGKLALLEGRRVKLGRLEGVLLRDGWGQWHICRMGGKESEAWHPLSHGEVPVDVGGDGVGVYTRSRK